MENPVLPKESSKSTEEGKPPNCCSSENDEPPSSFYPFRNPFFEKDADFPSWNNWRWQFKNRIKSIDELALYINFSPSEKRLLKRVTSRYPVSITPYYLSLINLRDPDDPIRIQSVPNCEETVSSGLCTEDPLGEKEDSVVPGLVHRYPDRVLMVLTNICPMLCRHCTRKREWHGGTWVRTDSEVEDMLSYIRKNPFIRDVIISGGDCLSLSTKRLERVIAGIRSIEHVEIIRIGSRFPVVLPQRIDEELCLMLSHYGPIWLNTHFNHPNEITPEAARACDMLLRSGVPVNNQSVLLKGVNDSVDIQRKLCQRLLRIKVRPYYLFQADEVEGTEHLRTSVETGIKIIEGLKGFTSGLAVPSFVVDLPGAGGKISLQPQYLLSSTKDVYVFRNYEGREFVYRNPGSYDVPVVETERDNVINL